MPVCCRMVLAQSDAFVYVLQQRYPSAQRALRGDITIEKARGGKRPRPMGGARNGPPSRPEELSGASHDASDGQTENPP